MTVFFSDIPVWTLILWAVLIVSLSLLLYRRRSWVKEISSLKRITLISLRSSGLFLLGVLLLGILIKGIDSEVDQPIIITVVDDSQSMLNYSDSLQVKNQTISFLKSVKNEFKDKYNHLIFTLDNLLEDVDSLGFDNLKTNLSQALEKVYNNYYGRNIGAIILLSDGNFNTGKTPLISTEKFKKTTIYSLSVGDTIQKADHLIKSVVANEIAFLGNKFPVEVSVVGNKTPNQTFVLKLLKDGKVIDSKELKHQDNDYSLVKSDFLLDANSVGMHEYTVNIESFSNEFNYENNTKTFYVEVLDDRSQVLLVSESLNPDVGAIRSALIPENNLELTTIQIHEIPDNLGIYDLIIWHNPGVSRDLKAFERIIQSGKPTWYIVTPQTSRVDISKLQLLANINTTGQMDNVGAAFNQGFNLFKLSPEARKAIDKFPPLKSHYGAIKYNNVGATFAYQRVGAIVKTDPLFYFGTRENVKFAVTYGSGLWGWRLTDFQMNQSHNNFNEIIRKSVQYLILKENTSRLRINLPSIASSDEDFVINASFYNESYEPVTTSTIRYELIKPNGESFDYAFLALENDYTLNLGKLPAGKYTWRASTEYNGKSFEKEGTFGIKDLALEKQATKSNHQLLKQIAENGNGKFALLSDYKIIIDDLKERKDIVPVAYASSTYHKLIDYLWLMLLIVAIFSTEWVIRRYSGAY
ncbi:MAG TPA: hypothetical protein VKX29_00065 [Brumimicrobium sp.]|nr:hypothetical protein [Brumimicrobium sp.]